MRFHYAAFVPRRALWAAIACAGFLAWLAFDPLGAEASVAFSDLALGAAAALTAVACFARHRTASPSGDEPRRRGPWFWWPLGAACASWAVGQAVWSFEHLVLDRDLPFPSVADVMFLAFGPLASLALVTMARGRPAILRVRALLDALGTAVPLLFAVWVLGGSEIWSRADLDLVEQLVLTSYPLRDVLLIGVALSAAVHTRGPTRRAALWVAASFIVLGVTNSIYVVQLVNGSFAVGSPLDVGWLASFLLLAVAAAAAPRGATAAAATAAAATAATAEEPAVDMQSRNAGLHYAGLLVSSAVGVWAAVADELDALALVMILVAVWLFIVRQLLADRHIRSLTARLASQLAEASDLQARTALAISAVNMITWEMEVAEGSIAATPPDSNEAGFPAVDCSIEEALIKAVDPTDVDRVRHWLTQLRAGDESQLSCSFWLTVPGGARRLESSAIVTRDAAGRPVRVIGGSVDVTDLLAEQTQREQAEQRFKVMFESAPLGLAILDLEGNVIEVNPALATLLGETAASLIGTHASVGSVDLEATERRLAAARAGEKVMSRHEYRRADESIGVVDYVASAIADASGAPEYLLLSVNDVTEHAQAQRTLAESELRLRHVIDASPTAIVETDADGLVQVWNPAAERLFGWTADEVLGRPFPASDPALEKTLQSMLEDNQRSDKVVAWGGPRVRKDGTMVDVLVSVAPLQAPDGRIGRLRVITARDEHQRQEDQVNEFRRMEALGRLAGGVAHDFNNLLTAIIACSETLATGIPTDSPLSWEVDAIRTAGRQAADLTQQLLTFSRGGPDTFQAVLLDPTVASVTGLLRRLVGEHIELECDLNAEDVLVSANRSLIEQVLVNLVTNARDAMPDGGRLRVRTESGYHGSENTFCSCIAVNDEGTGMAPSVFARCLEPFFSTKEPGRGTGLGLSQVYGNVVGAGGSVEIDTAVGRGTTVTVHLPAASGPSETALSATDGWAIPAAAAAAAEAEAEAETEAAADRPADSLVVLLAEDDAQVRALAARLLRRAGHTVIQAESGDHALLLSQSYEGAIDLLVTDIVMPGRNGVEVANSLERERPGLRTLFMSGYPGDEGPALATDSRPRLSKPFVPATLLAAVEAAAGGGRVR